MPNFCLCGMVGIHTPTSIKNPTKNPSMKPHKKSRSVPTLTLIPVLPLLRHKVSLFIPTVTLAILLVMLLIIKLLACQLLAKFKRNLLAGPCACIHASAHWLTQIRASVAARWSYLSLLRDNYRHDYASDQFFTSKDPEEASSASSGRTGSSPFDATKV
jgi:hypothetical protein